MTISVRSVTKAYADKTGNVRTPIRDLNLEVTEGSFCSLVGLSGCGKTTLLNMIGGLLAPTSGSVEVFGHTARTSDPSVAYMFQNDTLLPWHSVLDNVLLPIRAVGSPDRDRAAELVELVGLKGYEKSFPSQLSGGMRKRVQLARLFAQEAQVLLLDEPFGALDAHTKMLMQEEFLRIWQATRRTVVFVTHDLYEAITLSDRIVHLSERQGGIAGDHVVSLPRPRDVQNAVRQDEFSSLFTSIWSAMRDEENERREGAIA